jgi:hypothetical protein
MPPHGAGKDEGFRCTRDVDWREQAKRLAAEGITVHAVLVGDDGHARASFLEIAGTTGGRLVELSDALDLPPLLAAICMKEDGRLDRFVRSLDAKGQLTASRERLLLSLSRPLALPGPTP